MGVREVCRYESKYLVNYEESEYLKLRLILTTLLDLARGISKKYVEFSPLPELVKMEREIEQNVGNFSTNNSNNKNNDERNSMKKNSN